MSYLKKELDRIRREIDTEDGSYTTKSGKRLDIHVREGTTHTFSIINEDEFKRHLDFNNSFYNFQQSDISFVAKGILEIINSLDLEIPDNL